MAKKNDIEAKLRDYLAKPVPEGARLRRIGELIQKRNSGKRLSKGELGELESFAKEGTSNAELRTSNVEPTWVSSREKLGALLGVHPNTFPQWMKAFPLDAGLKELKRANGDWCVPAWRAFMERNGLSGERTPSPRPSPPMGERESTSSGVARKLQLELERLEEQVRELRRINDSEERKFLVKAEVERVLIKRATWERERLLKLKREVPPRFAGLAQTEFAVRWGPYVDALIEEFARFEAAEVESGE